MNHALVVDEEKDVVRCDERQVVNYPTNGVEECRQLRIEGRGSWDPSSLLSNDVSTLSGDHGMRASLVIFPEPAVSVYQPLALRLHLPDPSFEGRDPVLETIRAFLWGVQVEIVKTSGKEIDHPTARAVGRVELIELFVNDTSASQARQWVVRGKVAWSASRLEMAQPIGEGILTPRAFEEVVVRESVDVSYISCYHEVAPKPKGGYSRQQFHGTDGHAPKAACDPADSAILTLAIFLKFLRMPAPFSAYHRGSPYVRTETM